MLSDYSILLVNASYSKAGGHRGRGRDRMVVGFTTTNAVSAYNH